MSILIAATLLSPAVRADGRLPPDTSRLAYLEQPGERLPEHLELTSSDGQQVQMADLAAGRPLILVLGYFDCPNLCPVVRASLYKGLALARLAAGRDYALAALSIDPLETPRDAAQARDRDLAAFDVRGDLQFVRYLTASPTTIHVITESVGFHETAVTGPIRQWMHPAGIVFVTPEGVISSYLLGVGYRPADVSLALERARARGIVAQVAAPLLLLCFHFDPSTGRYSLEILNLLRMGALLTVLVVAGLLVLSHRRDRTSA